MTSSKEIAKLLIKIPYFIMRGPVPPLRVINDLLRHGEWDGGMSGLVNWKPFELSENMYSSVLNELRRLKPWLINDDAPPEVVTFEDWSDWKVIRLAGEMAPELSNLMKIRNELTCNIESLLDRREEARADELQIQLIAVCSRISCILSLSRGVENVGNQ